MDYRGTIARHEPNVLSLGSIESEIGSEAYARLLEAFLHAFPLQLAELRSAAAAGDLPGVRYVAHQLKGNATSFGAVHLDELADQVLRIPRDQCGPLDLIVDEFSEEFARLASILGGYGVWHLYPAVDHLGPVTS
jgi:HPt (histidine-containing phosphotransfer) domain-containing protein